MAIVHAFTSLMMFLIGAIVGVAVVGFANIFGVAGWLAGVVFAGLVLVFIVLDDKLMGFVMRLVVRTIGRMSKVEPGHVEEPWGKRHEYYAFLAGSVLGIVAALIWTPSAVIDALSVMLLQR